MPYTLDDLDIAIINALVKDGRKSFRQISREINSSTPTIKSRYERLVNIGLIKSVSPVIDTNKLVSKSKSKLENRGVAVVSNVKLKPGMSVDMECDYCDGTIGSKPQVFKFADYERFFCCNTCKSAYKEKFKGRIESIIKKSSN